MPFGKSPLSGIFFRNSRLCAIGLDIFTTYVLDQKIAADFVPSMGAAVAIPARVGIPASNEKQPDSQPSKGNPNRNYKISAP